MGRTFPEIPRTLCSKSIDLQVDLYAEENGEAVHEHCYVTRIKAFTAEHLATAIGD